MRHGYARESCVNDAVNFIVRKNINIQYGPVTL